MNLLFDIFKFIVNIIPEAVGAFIGVWGALYVLKRQKILELEIDTQNKNEEQIEVLNYSSFLLNSLIHSFELDNSNLEDYAIAIADNPYLTLKPPIAVASNDASRFLNLIDGKEYLNIFLKHLGSSDKNLKEYNMIINSVDYLSVVRGQIQELANSALKNDYERRIRYNDNVIKNINEMKDYAYDNILDFFEILQIINPTQIVYGNDRDFTMDMHSNQLVKPLIGLVQNLYSDDLFLKPREFELHQSISIAEHLKLNNKNYAEDIYRIVDYVNTTIKALKENSKTLIKYTQDNI